MCRLFLSTATNVPNPVLVDLLHWTMAVNAEDNTHGNGIAYPAKDGSVHLFKSVKAYWASDFDWVRDFAANAVGPVMGHVRAASAGTEVSNRTAHPFAFELSDGTPFVGMHNGYFSGLTSRAGADEPKSDSYVAFSALREVLDRIEPDRDLTYADIKAWASIVCTFSAYAVIFMFRNRFYVFRNSQRTLHATRFGNGLLITTAKSVAEAVVRYTASRYGGNLVDVNQPVIALPDNVLYSIRPGDGSTVMVEKFEDFEQGTGGAVYGRNRSTSNFRGGWGGDEWDGDESDYGTYRPRTLKTGAQAYSTGSSSSAITQPLNTETTSLTSLKNEKWRMIREALNPARERFALLMLRAFLRVPPSKEYTWLTASLEELNDFLGYVNLLIGKDERAFLNVWNHRVEKEHEYETFVSLYGSAFASNANPFSNDFPLGAMYEALDAYYHALGLTNEFASQ